MRHIIVYVVLAVLGLGSALSPQVANAATFSIATTGSDSNPCTLAQPCLTFPKGVSKLSGGGDILYVRTGTYRTVQNFDSSTMASGTSWANAIVIAPYPGDAVTLDGIGVYTHTTNGSPQYVIFQDFTLASSPGGCVGIINNPNGLDHPADSYIRFQNIDCHGWTAPLNSGGCCGYYLFANHVEIIGGKVHDGPWGAAGGSPNPCDIPGVWDCHGLYVSGAYNLIDGVEIYNNSGIGIQFYNGYFGGASGDAHDNIIRNSRVHNNGIAPSCCTGGIELQSGANNLAYNNVVYNNPLSFGIDGGVGGAQIYNNTTYGNGWFGVGVGGPQTAVQIKNNLVADSIYNGGNGTIFATNLCVSSGPGCAMVGDPLFVNAAASNFALQAGSPAIDAGTTISGVATDIAGVARPQGSAYDIGAYEYRQGLPPSTVAAPANFRLVSP